MLESKYPWLSDNSAGQQVSECLPDASMHICTNSGDALASFDLSSVSQEPSTISAIPMIDNQQSLWLDCPALPVDQSVELASLFTDGSCSASYPNLNPTAVCHDIESLPAFQGYAPAKQWIDAESFYRNAGSPVIHQNFGSATEGQSTNLLDTNAALSMQHTLEVRLCKELERSLLEEVPCVLEFGAGLVTESEITAQDPQLNHEHSQQNEERLKNQDERIRQLELAMHQQQQQARPELPQVFIDIPRQWVEVQTNVEQYFKRFTDWAEGYSQASAGDAVKLVQRIEDLEAEVRALRQYIDSTS